VVAGVQVALVEHRGTIQFVPQLLLLKAVVAAATALMLHQEVLVAVAKSEIVDRLLAVREQQIKATTVGMVKL